ncbi:phosphomannomutase/phosphoglucomutase [Methylocaldum sp.]|uniref:phosphomannomutase/phosphoglucomutase n=1 Tax=Methylocaldum sp. TaxID=1969727 RepID=UPI002D2A1402|nr:phosphomannomutase/phosphoglucomutase [Methylocaldum sp.]HYE35093.1 phosphomannomutase/phosphoglucomutase [Methylocaldum sp.]
MSLGRLFSLIAAATSALTLLTGAGLYLAAWQSATENASATVQMAAQASANNIKQSIGLLNQILDQLARDSHLAQVIQTGDTSAILAEEERLTHLIPGASLVRLLPEAVAALDEQRTPHMGYADLDMVRQAKTANPLPAMHAANTSDAHLALARRFTQGGGVILASLSPNIAGTGSLPILADGAVELRQDALSLAYQGNEALKGESPSGELAVSGTPWKLVYWQPASVSTAGLWFLLIPLVSAAVMGACTFFVYRWSVKAVTQDQGSVLKLVKDLFTGKVQGHYPVQIKDLQPLIIQLTQLKRVTRNADAQAAIPVTGEDRATGETVESLPTVETISPTIFRAYDIRGVVGDTLTPKVVHLIGLAIGSEVQEKGEQRVVVARDGRLSSPELSQALSKGLRESGCTVIDVGLAPTPVLYFATYVLNTRSGVMITGSHNPADYNGLKIVIAGETLAEKGIQKLRTRIEKNDFSTGQGQVEKRDIVPSYIERIVDDTQVGRPMKVVVDCGNGVAGDIAPTLLEQIGCEVVPLFCDVDGNFPNHHPDPSKPENLETLIQTVLREQADLGVAFDGDADRLGVVDSSGKIIWPDRQMMVFAADVLSREPGADIIYDVKCTRHLAGHIIRHGGRPLMWKTGHSLMKAKIKKTGALLAGEMSGHIFFKERWFGFDDGIYACARLVEILSGDPRSTAEVFAELPDSVNTPEINVTLTEGENFKFVYKLQQIADFPDARITDIDGLRVDFSDGWGLVRASNTTPSLVIRFEADTPKALSRIQGQFKALMLKVKPDIALPF